MLFLAIAAIAATLISEVSAHSRVCAVWAGGKDLGGGAGDFVRFPKTDGPVLDLTSQNLRCNEGGDTPVPNYASVPAGDIVTAEWCT